MSDENVVGVPAGSTGSVNEPVIDTGVPAGSTGSVNEPVIDTGVTGAVAQPEKVDKEESITLPRSAVEQMLARMSVLENKVGAALYAADKDRLLRYEQKNQPNQLIKSMAVGIWSWVDPSTSETVESIVVGWKKIQDDVFIEDNGGVRRLIEKQIIRLFLDDGASKPIRTIDIDYAKFYPNLKRKSGDVVSETKADNGNTVARLRFEDGREIDVDIRFVNP